MCHIGHSNDECQNDLNVKLFDVQILRKSPKENIPKEWYTFYKNTSDNMTRAAC